ncbi:MAG: hypothetical protein IPJ89_02565 [Candidatus Iainarchaeum archaeon]|uniref:Uncharacterized protein n=1 Tax=Candidatus Iainarchaeum sp. TaxID=3101447 RepID=A0A7T9I2T6_9ARCH|nr:MAG: hypothetical protein IPJ89_02565 [Candidatus Diapherotrites archaeon]
MGQKHRGGSWLWRRRMAATLRQQKRWNEKASTLRKEWIILIAREHWAYQQLRTNNLLQPQPNEPLWSFKLRGQAMIRKQHEHAWQRKLARLFAMRVELLKSGRKALSKAQHRAELEDAYRFHRPRPS